MQTALIWATAVTTFVTFAVHTFIGGVYVARPLLADQGLPKAAKWLAYYCWHIVTMLLFAMALAYAAIAAGRLPFGIMPGLSAFAAACSGLSFAVAIKGGIAPWRFPSTTLFALIAAFGSASLWGNP